MSNSFEQLKAPFDVSDVEYRPGATTKDKTRAIGLAYVDKRVYEERLDTCWGTDWHVEYRPLSDKAVICKLTILEVIREDVGEYTADDVASYPTAVAQAFKRACSAFGLGRYLYALPQTWAEYDADRRRFTDEGLAHLKRAYDAALRAQQPVVSQSSAVVYDIHTQRVMTRIESLQDTLDGMGISYDKVSADMLTKLNYDGLIEYGKLLKRVLDTHKYD